MRGLQKTAEEGQHARFACAQAAARARRDATKLAVSSAAPLPEIVKPPTPRARPSLSPSEKRLLAFKASNPKAATEVEATPPTSLFQETQGFKLSASMSAVGAKLTPRLLTPKRKPGQTATAIAKRMANLKLTRAWIAWVESAHEIRVQRRAIAIFMQPYLSRAMETWCEWYEARGRALATIRHAIHTMSMMKEIRAFQLWSQRAHLRTITRNAALTLGPSGLGSSLRFWHRVASHRAFHQRLKQRG